MALEQTSIFLIPKRLSKGHNKASEVEEECPRKSDVQKPFQKNGE